MPGRFLHPRSRTNYTGLTFSAHGPFLPWPSVKDTFWPSRRSSKVTPWTAEEWKNRSFALARVDKTEAPVRQPLDCAFCHSLVSRIDCLDNDARLMIADWPSSIGKSLPSRGARTQVGCGRRRRIPTAEVPQLPESGLPLRGKPLLLDHCLDVRSSHFLLSLFL